MSNEMLKSLISEPDNLRIFPNPQVHGPSALNRARCQGLCEYQRQRHGDQTGMDSRADQRNLYTRRLVLSRKDFHFDVPDAALRLLLGSVDLSSGFCIVGRGECSDVWLVGDS